MYDTKLPYTAALPMVDLPPALHHGSPPSWCLALLSRPLCLRHAICHFRLPLINRGEGGFVSLALSVYYVFTDELINFTRAVTVKGKLGSLGGSGRLGG